MSLSALRFIIIEDDDFIAGDMATGLRRASPEAVVLHVRETADVAALPADPARISVFITSDRLSDIDASGLAALAEDVSGEIVVREGLDSNAAVKARGYHSLRAPFTDAALLTVAEEFLARRAA